MRKKMSSDSWPKGSLASLSLPDCGASQWVTHTKAPGGNYTEQTGAEGGCPGMGDTDTGPLGTTYWNHQRNGEARKHRHGHKGPMRNGEENRGGIKKFQYVRASKKIITCGSQLQGVRSLSAKNEEKEIKHLLKKSGPKTPWT